MVPLVRQDRGRDSQEQMAVRRSQRSARRRSLFRRLRNEQVGLDEVADRHDAFRSHPIAADMVLPRRLGHRDHQVVEHPVQLEMLRMRRGDAGNAGEPSEQNAEKMRSAHVRMHDFNAAAADFFRHAAEFGGRESPHLGMDHTDRFGGQLLGNPGAGRAEQRHAMPPSSQFAAQIKAMDHGAIDAVAGNDLHHSHINTISPSRGVFGRRNAGNRPSRRNIFSADSAAAIPARPFPMQSRSPVRTPCRGRRNAAKNHGP